MTLLDLTEMSVAITQVATHRALMMTMDLCQSEAVAMVNLGPANADVAKRLIVSLVRYSDEDVDELCKIVQRHYKAAA